VRRRLLFTSAIVSIVAGQHKAPQSHALPPVTSALESLLSSIQTEPEAVMGNESMDVLVLLQNLLHNLRAFADSCDCADARVSQPLALLFYHSIFTVIETDEDAFRDLQMEGPIRDIGFIRLPECWLSSDAEHVLPALARLVAALGLAVNEAEGLFASALLHFLRDRCADAAACTAASHPASQTQPPCSRVPHRIVLWLLEGRAFARGVRDYCPRCCAAGHVRISCMDRSVEPCRRIGC
jgi:hypothetical protein